MPTVSCYTELKNSLPIYINYRVSKYKVVKSEKDIIEKLKQVSL